MYGRECFQGRECLGGECPTLPAAWPGKGMSRRGISYISSSMTREGNVQEGNVLHFQQHDQGRECLGGEMSQQHDQGRECPGGEMSHTSSSMTREGNVQERNVLHFQQHDQGRECPGGECPTLPAAWPGKRMSRRGNVPHFQQHDQGRECPGGEMSHTFSSMTREGNV